MSFRLRYLALLPLLVATACQQPANTNTKAIPDAQVQPIIVNNSWIEISRSALDFNIKKVQALLGDKSSLCAVLKGDAYGHDLTLVTPLMIENNVQCIGLTNNQEFKQVRELGFKGRLMRVRNATEQEMAQATAYDVEELIGNLDMAQRLNDIGKKQNKVIPIHLALNSAGMSRNGLEVSHAQGLNDAKMIAQLPQLKVVGIMSHYPEEDEAQIRKDLAKFKKQSQQVLDVTGLKREDVILHVANTYATITVPESWLDMVRVGGIFYGDTVATKDYKRVMTLKSNIASVNHYPKGNTVGYADGYRRVFSNAGHALINGQTVPVLGKTSMNTVMVDVTDLKQVQPGDEVVFFGKQGNGEITAEEVEDISGALFTEMSILWGATNKRILVD
ncbi:alanine racemase [Providencia stuartii]|nr:alanine racemase [Providencia stuartii]